MNASTQEIDDTPAVMTENNSLLSPGKRLFLSFWLFGTLVGIQFSVVVTAANDLVADRAPTGLILFAYTLPSVLIRTLVPFISFSDLSTHFPSSHRGANGQEAGNFYSAQDPSSPPMEPPRETITHKQAMQDDPLTKQVNYPLRLAICAFSSFCGLQLLAWADLVWIRLVGIAMASLSSNLGDMSCLQLCSRYPKSTGPKSAVGGYMAGGGSAAFVGAFIYTFSTSTLRFSSSATISVIGVFPVALLFTYTFLLPRPADAGQVDVVGGVADAKEEGISGLSFMSKLRIASPMFWSYMAPLAAVMFADNTTVQGVLPTLLFYLPFPPSATPLTNLLNSAFRTTRDFYPIYVTVYQFSIFVGRSSISFFRLPDSPVSSWGLVVVELAILSLQVSESLSMTAQGVLYGPLVVLCLVSCMGLCGGLSLSHTYWRVNSSALPNKVWEALERARGGYVRVETEDVSPHTHKLKEEEIAIREFLLSAIAPPDTFAILLASAVSMRVQQGLCAVQVMGGRELCRRTGV